MTYYNISLSLSLSLLLLQVRADWFCRFNSHWCCASMYVCMKVSELLELQTVVSCHVGTGVWTLVLWKSSLSQPTNSSGSILMAHSVLPSYVLLHIPGLLARNDLGKWTPSLRIETVKGLDPMFKTWIENQAYKSQLKVQNPVKLEGEKTTSLARKPQCALSSQKYGELSEITINSETLFYIPPSCNSPALRSHTHQPPVLLTKKRETFFSRAVNHQLSNNQQQRPFAHLQIELIFDKTQ